MKTRILIAVLLLSAVGCGGADKRSHALDSDFVSSVVTIDGKKHRVIKQNAGGDNWRTVAVYPE